NEKKEFESNVLPKQNCYEKPVTCFKRRSCIILHIRIRIRHQTDSEFVNSSIRLVIRWLHSLRSKPGPYRLMGRYFFSSFLENTFQSVYLYQHVTCHAI